MLLFFLLNDADPIPHEFIFIDEAGFNLTKVRRGRNIIGHRMPQANEVEASQPVLQVVEMLHVFNIEHSSM